MLPANSTRRPDDPLNAVSLGCYGQPRRRCLSFHG